MAETIPHGQERPVKYMLQFMNGCDIVMCADGKNSPLRANLIRQHTYYFIMGEMMYYSLDYGHGKIVLVWGQGSGDQREYKKFSEVVKDLPNNSILICERSLANFDRNDYNAGLVLAAQKNIELRAVSTNAVKNYRKLINDPKPIKNAPFTEDIKDAKILLLLFGKGSTRAYGKFTEYVKKPLPTELRARFKSLLVDARRYEKWKPQKAWLKAHNLEDIPVLCGALLIANEVRALGLSRRVYRKYTRISEFGRANPIHRSNGTHWVYRNSKNKNWSRLEDRKVRAKKINEMIDQIWHLTGGVFHQSMQ